MRESNKMSKIATLQEPTQIHERIAAIDILRGLALLGILLVNFAGSEAARTGAIDDQVRHLLNFFVSSKFYTTFSFLFGLGFALQLLRAQQRQSRIVPVYLRRMAVLFLIGAFHAVFIWSGDVLKYYAVMGIALILFRKLPGKVLLIVAVLCLGFEFWTYLPSAPPSRFADLIPAKHDPEMEQQNNLEETLQYARIRETGQQMNLAIRSGTYGQAVKARFQFEKARCGYWDSFFWPSSFAMFLLGLYAGRRGIFHDLGGHQKYLRRVMWIVLLPAIVFNLYAGYGPQILGRFFQVIPDWASNVMYVLAGPLGSLFYISALLLLLSGSERWMRRLGFLRWVGRMPLTNYLMQSLVGTLVYYHYGLGLHSRLSFLQGLLLTVAVFAGQVPLSRWWLSRFKFGPVEWLWRTLTYGHPQSMRERKMKTAF
jgi:uncharacterized protein